MTQKQVYSPGLVQFVCVRIVLSVLYILSVPCCLEVYCAFSVQYCIVLYCIVLYCILLGLLHTALYVICVLYCVIYSVGIACPVLFVFHVSYVLAARATDILTKRMRRRRGSCAEAAYLERGTRCVACVASARPHA